MRPIRRVLLMLVLAIAASGCREVIEVRSNTRWHGVVNNADVAGAGDCRYELWDNARSFTFTKDTPEGYLGVRFIDGRGDEPETTAPYGTIWGSAWDSVW